MKFLRNHIKIQIPPLYGTLVYMALLIALVFHPLQSYAIPSFPGAEGFGADSIGGRGGQVIKVTNLNDSGPGSFREAVMSSGPRIVVFGVSGIINLQSDLTISQPYITIAGQTSPGGILLTRKPVRINTHDVIIQHVRFRLGSHGISSDNDAEAADALQIAGNSEPSWFPNPAYNIVIDHCSISWGVDEDFEISLGATDITVQWSIISEGLSNAGHPKGEHSKGLLIWGRLAATEMNISFHHNYLAHNRDRNPMISGATAKSPYPDVFIDAVNNVIYNYYGNLSMMTYTTAKANWLQNYVKRGPGSTSYSFEAVHFPEGHPVQQQLYTEGNIGAHRSSQSDAEWSIGRMWYNELLDTGYRVTSPWPAPAVQKATMSHSVASCILSAVGATAPVRDSVDTRVIADFMNNSGSYKDNVSYPGDFPAFANNNPPADSDNDGMADDWEATYGLNTETDDSAADKDGNGYTNIEEYLHYLSRQSYTYNSDCMIVDIPLPPENLRIVQ